MPYTVAGTLKLPETGQPAAGVILKFIALQSISPVLDRFESVIVTSSTGAYSIQLEYNTYSVFATLYDNKPINCGQIVLNSTVATGLDLPTLLNDGFSEPTTPSWIVELQRLADVTTSAAQAAATSANVTTSAAQAAATSASQAATSATASSASATSAATSATASSASATASSASASQAAASATSAATSATASSASASQAAASATSSAATSASQASTSAAAAAASAAQASQISGLSTVAEAIGLAAIPLPDVWAPLSDSLRMITGYGREVKVGEDVVSQMVNFSRSTTRTYTAKDGTLKIAAINEPCFEKEGLHLDVQSTNLWASQTAVDSLNAAPASTSLPDGTTGSIYKITPTLGAFAFVRKNFAAQSGNHTLSCFAKLDDGSKAMPSLYCGSNGSYSTKLTGVYVGNGWWRMQAALLDPFGNIGFGYNHASTETTLVWVCNFQLEALPFASSYIPTNGAAVTRAADLLQVVGPGNHPDILSGVPFTLAMRMSCEEAASGSMRDLLFCQSVAYSLLRRSNNTIRYYRDGSGQLAFIAPAKTVNVVAVRVSAGNVCTLRVGSNQVSRTEVPITGGKVSAIDISKIAGHVRDFRIWQHAVTDEQLKAIA